MYLNRYKCLVGCLNYAHTTARSARVCLADRRCYSESQRRSQDSTKEYSRHILHTSFLGFSAVAVSGLAFYAFYDALHIPDAVKATLETIRQRQDVKELLGDDFVFRSDWIVQQHGDEAHVEVNAAGKKAGGTFHCMLLNVDGKWKVMKLDVIYNATKEGSQLDTKQLYDDLQKALGN